MANRFDEADASIKKMRTQMNWGEGSKLQHGLYKKAVEGAEYKAKAGKNPNNPANPNPSEYYKAKRLSKRGRRS